MKSATFRNVHEITSVFYIRRKITGIILCALLVLCCTTSGHAITLHNMVVFGDSLSDNGNLYADTEHDIPASPPYFQGRFCNGPIWVEKLMVQYFPQDSKSHLIDYAFGGAGVIDDALDDGTVKYTLKREVDSYLLAHQDKVDANNLYIIWMGANNYLALPEDANHEVDTVTAGIKQSLTRLSERGARYFLLVNMPDLGLTPFANEFATQDELTNISKKHNKILTEIVTQLHDQYPEVQWLLFDSFSLIHDMMAHPSKYNFQNVTDSCYQTAIDELTPATPISAPTIAPQLSTATDACTGYLFFDEVHPSAAAHTIMAARAKSLLESLGIAFS